MESFRSLYAKSDEFELVINSARYFDFADLINEFNLAIRTCPKTRNTTTTSQTHETALNDTKEPISNAHLIFTLSNIYQDNVQERQPPNLEELRELRIAYYTKYTQDTCMETNPSTMLSVITLTP